MASVAVGVLQALSVVAQAYSLGLVAEDGLHHDLGGVAGPLWALVGATGVRAAASGLAELLAARASSALKSDLRGAALRKVVESGPAWRFRRPSGDLAVLLGAGLDSLDDYVGRYLPRMLLAFLVPAVSLAWVAWVDPLSAGIILATLALLPLFMILVGKHTRERLAKRWESLSELSAGFLDSLEGMEVLRSYQRTRQRRRWIAEASNQLRRRTLVTLRTALLSSLVLEIFAAVGTALVAVPLGLRLVSGKMSLAVALSILVLAPEIYLAVRKASGEFHSAAAALPVLDELWSILDFPQQPGIRTTPETTPPAASYLFAELDTPSLELRLVRATWPGSNHLVLEDCSVLLEPGERLAILGPSGAGKSSLVALFLGLLQPISGEVRVRGQSLEDPEVLAAWRREVAWVPQRPNFVWGSVADNLRLGAPEAPEGLLWQALWITCSEEVVRDLPHGLGACLGEHASQLSQGERQRLALARAVVRLLSRRCQFAILDEPTAHLDPETEKLVVDRLASLLGEVGLLLVTHRSEPLRLVERRLSLVRGRLVSEAAISGRGVSLR